jgi:hypothetical protein
MSAVLHIYKTIGKDGISMYFLGTPEENWHGMTSTISGLVSGIQHLKPEEVKFIVFSPKFDMLRWGDCWMRCLSLSAEEQKNLWEKYCSS